MSGEVTVCFYLVLGACVAVALWLVDANPTGTTRTFRACSALLFWPLYLPVLLATQGSSLHSDETLPSGGSEPPLPLDEMAAAIHQVETELDTALCSLNGWAEEALCAEADRFAELRAAWHQQAEKIRELDRLLSASDSEEASLEAVAVGAESSSATNRITSSEHARRENLSKLKHVRHQWHDDLLATLAGVRQLVTMIHLARYTGEPASRAAELLQQIEQAIQGLPKETSQSCIE